MSLDPETAETLGMLKEYVSQAKIDRVDAKDFRDKMYLAWDKVNEKADKAHARIDKHEVKFGTIKYIAGLIAAIVAFISKWVST